AAVVPELVVWDHAARGVVQATHLRIDQIAILARVFFALELRRFVGGEELLGPEHQRPFEGRYRAEIPNTLKIGVAAGRARRSPLVRSRRLLCDRWGLFRRVDRYEKTGRRDDDYHGKENSILHLGLSYLSGCLRRSP